MPRSEGGSTTDEDAAQTSTYTVKAGDTLSDIAESEMGDAKRWPELYAANKDAIGENPDLIHPGLELKIPA